MVQRPDVGTFTPNDAEDAAFGQALREAARSGVEVYSYRCNVSTDEIAIAEPLKVRL